jgi:hypothetical protein
MSEKPVIDSRNNWQLIDELLTTETNEWRITMLRNLKEHMQAECGGDIDALLNTMIDEPVFHNWTATQDSGPKGYDALREFYSGLIASGANRFEFSIERIIIGDDTLVTEGAIRIPFAGSMLLSMGIEGVSKDTIYATRGRTVTFWPFDPAGKIIGEDIYSMTTDFDDLEEVTLIPYSYGDRE